MFSEPPEVLKGLQLVRSRIDRMSEMLVVDRKENESVIGANCSDHSVVRISIAEIHDNRVRMEFGFPKHVTIEREELRRTAPLDDEVSQQSSSRTAK